MLRVLVASLLLPAVAVAAPQLSVGFGEVDVSPKIGAKPVYMAGFGHDRQAKKVHDPIMARAVVLTDGTKKIALVSVDVVGLFFPVIESVRKQLKGFDYVCVSSTHNHEGPDTLGLWGRTPFTSGIDPAYMTSVEAGIVKAVTDADKAKRAAVAKIGVVNGGDLLNDSRLPVVKHEELVAIRFDPAESDKPAKPLGILIQWNCHPELLGSKNVEVSADHVGYTVKHVQDKYGCPVAYFTGTVGGLMSSLKVPLKNARGEELKDGTFEKTEEFGVRVGKLAVKAVADSAAVSLVPFDIRTKAVLVPVENGLYRLAKQVGVLKRDMYPWTGDPHPKEWKPTLDAAKPVGIKSEVGFVKLGDLEIAAIPGEIYPELVLDKVQTPADPGADFPNAPTEPAIYPGMKGKHKMLIGLANDELGYFIPKRQWDEKKPYCYGLKQSQYGEVNSCGPDAAKVICDTFRSLATGK